MISSFFGQINAPNPLDFLHPWLEQFMLQCRLNGSAVENLGKADAGIFPVETVFDCNRLPDSPANFTVAKVLAGQPKTDGPVFAVGSPAAGRIPGIIAQSAGGQIGQLLDLGEVQWIRHGRRPHPAQTFESMTKSLARCYDFFEGSYPDREKITIGNCQNGCSSMIAKLYKAAIAPEAKMLDGIYIGSPLSFWAGKPNSHSIRFLSARIGSLFIRFISDLCGGIFDGAWNSFNFASYNLGHTLSEKPLRDFEGRKNPETVEKMLLFSKWLKNFHYFSKDQIVGIVEKLFIGNELELDKLEIDEIPVSFKNLTGTHVFAASNGDDISDLYYAWAWILNYFSGVNHIRDQNLRIILSHIPNAGHLAIFSSDRIAKKEIRPLAANFTCLQALEPGLYLTRPQVDGKLKTQPISFDELREIIPHHRADHELHRNIASHSKRLSDWYETFAGPFVRACHNPILTSILRKFHPMRFWRNTCTPRSPLFQVACTFETKEDPLSQSIFNYQMATTGIMAKFWENQMNTCNESFARLVHS